MRGDVLQPSSKDGIPDGIEVPFGPSSVPFEREKLATFWRTFGPKIIEDSRGILYNATPGVYAEQLDESSMYWVTDEMSRLIDEAAKSVPHDTQIPFNLFPSRSGFVVFETALIGIDSFDEEDGSLFVNALQWQMGVRDRHDGSAPYGDICIDFYLYGGQPINCFFPVGGATWPIIGVHIDDEYETEVGTKVKTRTPYEAVTTTLDQHSGEKNDTDKQRSSQIEDRSRLAAFLGILDSPGVARLVEQHPNRNERRAATRAGRKTGSVSLVYLKKSETHSQEHSDDTRYHHRWIVAGHWRNQPYGPGRALRKPVWIRPHMKGPDDAPLLSTEKVTVV